ncbi:hypothetical protein ABZ319_06925 [Nocardia sp. NPDC005978]|uniref:hypothetical protein n=1 Tax=Nocardia sp. NPDC005978 TaxID=3156725 RepID=UPI0033B25444
MKIDYERLANELLQPPRRSRAAARLALLRHRNATSAMRSLFGSEDPRRRFLHADPCRACAGRGVEGGRDSDGYWEEDAWTCGDCGGTGDNPDGSYIPRPSRRHLLTLGSSIDAAREAEIHAWEVVARLRPWGLGSIDRLVWRVGNRAHHRKGAYLTGIPYSVEAQFHRILRHFDDELSSSEQLVPASLRPDRCKQPYVNRYDEVRNHACWERAAELGLEIPAGEQFSGYPFTDLPNPYTPLLQIWLTGFGLDRIEYDEIILYAPPR